MLRSMKSRLSGGGQSKKGAETCAGSASKLSSGPSTSGRGSSDLLGSSDSRQGLPTLSVEELQRAYAGVSAVDRAFSCSLLGCAVGWGRWAVCEAAYLLQLQPALQLLLNMLANPPRPLARRPAHRASLPPCAELLPSFRDVAAHERQALFVRKLHLCAFTFDFTDPRCCRLPWAAAAGAVAALSAAASARFSLNRCPPAAAASRLLQRQHAGEGDEAADAAGAGGLCERGRRQVHGAGRRREGGQQPGPPAAVVQGGWERQGRSSAGIRVGAGPAVGATQRWLPATAAPAAAAAAAVGVGNRCGDGRPMLERLDRALPAVAQYCIIRGRLHISDAHHAGPPLLQVADDIIFMLNSNLFRALPPRHARRPAAAQRLPLPPRLLPPSLQTVAPPLTTRCPHPRRVQPRARR